MYHSTLGLRVIKKKKKVRGFGVGGWGFGGRGLGVLGLGVGVSPKWQGSFMTDRRVEGTYVGSCRSVLGYLPSAALHAGGSGSECRGYRGTLLIRSRPPSRTTTGP